MKKENEMTETSDIEAVLRVISFTLQEAATQNELLSGPNVTLTRFHTLSPPKISIFNYIQFLHLKTNCAKSCFVIAMILLDRLLQLQTHIQITPNTVHKLFLCSLMTASKFNTDLNFANSAWAAVGGIRPEEMNILEIEFLFLLQFSINVTKEEFRLYSDELTAKAQLKPFKNGAAGQKQGKSGNVGSTYVGANGGNSGAVVVGNAANGEISEK